MNFKTIQEYEKDLKEAKKKYDKLVKQIKRCRSEYQYEIVDGWDLDTLVSFAYDTVVENLNKYSDDKLLEEVEQYSPDLLEEVDAV